MRVPIGKEMELNINKLKENWMIKDLTALEEAHKYMFKIPRIVIEPVLRD